MTDFNEFVALICLPCGQNAEQVSQQTTKMTSTFINYFTSKMAAGVVTRAPVSCARAATMKIFSIIAEFFFQHAPHPSCVAHVFPPCEFAVQQLQRLAPEIFDEIERSRSTYLFVVVTRADSGALELGDDHIDDTKATTIGAPTAAAAAAASALPSNFVS